MTNTYTQAGIYAIKLWEDKVLGYNYASQLNEEEIVGLSASGNSVILQYQSRPQLKIKSKDNANSNLTYTYELSCMIAGLSRVNKDVLKLLKESIYGWKPEFRFLDGSELFLDTPFFLTEFDADQNKSNSFNLKLETRQPTEQYFLEISGGSTFEFEDGISYLFEDNDQKLFE
jgi:hypothetical protein